MREKLPVPQQDWPKLVYDFLHSTIAEIPKAEAKLVDTVASQIGLALEPWHIAAERRGRGGPSIRCRLAQGNVGRQ